MATRPRRRPSARCADGQRERRSRCRAQGARREVRGGRHLGPLRGARRRRAFVDGSGHLVARARTRAFAKRRCCCASLSRTTSSSRPSASACSAPTSRTSGTRAALHRVVGGREVRIAAAPGGVDVEPLDDVTGRSSRSCSAPSSTSTPSTRGRRRGRCSASSCRGSPASGRRSRPTRSRASSPRSPRSRSRCSRRSRSAAGSSSARRAAAGAPTPSRPASGSRRRGGASSSRSASRGARPSTWSGSRAPTLDLDALARARRRRGARAPRRRCRGLGAWTAEWFLARHLARPRAWPAGDLALRKAVDLFYGSTCTSSVRASTRSRTSRPTTS